MTLEILVGMIASGKSTYARKRADEGALVISHDALTQMLHGGAYRYEKELRECYRSMEERLACLAIQVGRDAVIDRTHLARDSRRRWIDFANSVGVGSGVIAVTFPIETAFEHARRRLSHYSRGRCFGDWLAVAEHHHAQAISEPLSDDEGFSEIRGAPHLNLA